ncbi:hypothetical protein [Gellertiella hungarica]|uniref:Uncharacterized protein n=1 Tax=Gellertiella hungarica TaxID=1572859 RepID=A0A7W6J5Z6_9HYPH|nr:hypothetical protein [Gellertiella hungarica]MBB4065411.1 hypothetical protein [Gellertiella hungarica]
MQPDESLARMSAAACSLLVGEVPVVESEVRPAFALEPLLVGRIGLDKLEFPARFRVERQRVPAVKLRELSPVCGGLPAFQFGYGCDGVVHLALVPLFHPVPFGRIAGDDKPMRHLRSAIRMGGLRPLIGIERSQIGKLILLIETIGLRRPAIEVKEQHFGCVQCLALIRRQPDERRLLAIENGLVHVADRCSPRDDRPAAKQRSVERIGDIILRRPILGIEAGADVLAGQAEGKQCSGIAANDPAKGKGRGKLVVDLEVALCVDVGRRATTRYLREGHQRLHRCLSSARAACCRDQGISAALRRSWR